MRKNKQSLRSLTAFLVTWAFIVLTITGIILYIVPQGRIAYWIHWSLAGMDKEQWGWVHMMFGGVFIITGILHLYFNWKPFKKYFADRVKGHFELKQEIIIATVLTIAIFIVSVFNLPPASWVIELNSQIKDAWVTSPELEPPYGHAEEASLSGISKKMNFDINKVINALHTQGIEFENKKDSIDAIARHNNMTPMEIYEIIRVHKLPVLQKNMALLSPDEIEEKFSGTGIGRKTIYEVCQLLGVDLAIGIKRLQKAGISVKGTDKARAVAEKYERSPIDLLLIISRP